MLLLTNKFEAVKFSPLLIFEAKDDVMLLFAQLEVPNNEPVNPKVDVVDPVII